MMKRKSLIVLMMAMGLLFACQAPDQESATETDKEKEIEPVPVEIATLQRGNVDAVYVGTATLEADGEAIVKSKVNGEIVRLRVEEGDVVRAGQALAKIDDAKLRLEVARARANLEKVRKDYQRNIELHDKGLLPAGTFESMKYDLDALQATYELAQLELSYTTIKAPISGVISSRQVKVGNNIALGEAVFTITDLDPLIAYLYIPEKDFRKLSADQHVNIAADAIPGQFFSGKIARLSPVVDAATGTFKVTIEVDDKSKSLTPGMFGRVSIVYETFENVVLLPRAAIIDRDGESTVFVLNDKNVTQRTVATGHIQGKNIQVINGLDGSEQVVVIGQNGLKNDSLVKVIGSPDQPLTDPEDRAKTAVAQSE